MLTGIIEKKTSRQLKKWITRIGKKDENYLNFQGRQGTGRISLVGPLGTKVIWLDPPKDCPAEQWLQTGADGCGTYELLLYEEEDEATENAFEDGDMIHDGGGFPAKIMTFWQFFVPAVTKFLSGWLLFLGYFGMLYYFEISVATYSITLAQGQQYAMPGRLYNAEPGEKKLLHIQCKGYTKNVLGSKVKTPEDGRPPVVIVSMEALGMAAAMQRLQDSIAENGICCVYDRIGYGWSTATETGSTAWTNRTPAIIAAELHYALIDGKDIIFKRGIFWEKEIIGYDNKTTLSEVAIRPPFVLVAHSAGSLYARQFAHDYPEHVAGLVLVDALPAINNEHAKVTSPIHFKTPLFTLTLCHRYLQPMGMVNNLFSGIVTSLFSVKTSFAMQGGLPVNGKVLYQDFNIMTHIMFQRAWCPIVAAEYNGLFESSGRGIETVAAADRQGYGMPVVLWAREDNIIQGKSSLEPFYEYDVPKTEGSTAAAKAARSWVEDNITATKHRDSAGNLHRHESRRKSCAKSVPDPVAAGKSGPDAAAAGDAAGNEEAGGGCLTWFEIQTALQGSFQKSWTNPHTNKREVMRGDVDSCLINICSEYTSLENPAEVLDAVLDLWWDLGYSTPTPSNIWYIELAGRPSTFDEKNFKKDLSTLLSHVRPDEIRIVELPVEGLAPQSKWKDTGRRHYAEEDFPLSRARRATSSGSGVAGNGKNWYSGPADPVGASTYVPIKNDGAYHFGVQLLGHKVRSTDWAQNILRGTEDVNLDKTAMVRRGIFMRKHRVLSVRERKCFSRADQGGGNSTNFTNSTNSTQSTQGTKSVRRRLMQQPKQPTNQSNVSTSTSTTKDEVTDDSMTCTVNAIDIFTSTYAEPIYGCPQNSYRNFFGCDLCSSSATSPTASLSARSCQACASSRHLTCDGLGCQDCPKGYVSNVGSLLIGVTEGEEERESVCVCDVCVCVSECMACACVCISVHACVYGLVYTTCVQTPSIHKCMHACMDSLYTRCVSQNLHISCTHAPALLRLSKHAPAVRPLLQRNTTGHVHTSTCNPKH